jgi:hypothetical protein
MPRIITSPTLEAQTLVIASVVRAGVSSVDLQKRLNQALESKSADYYINIGCGLDFPCFTWGAFVSISKKRMASVVRKMTFYGHSSLEGLITHIEQFITSDMEEWYAAMTENPAPITIMTISSKRSAASAPPTDLVPGDRVLVVNPDPDYGGACIAAGFDAAYLVKAVDGIRLQVECRLPLMRDPMPLDACEVIKTDRLPWWDEQAKAAESPKQQPD